MGFISKGQVKLFNTAVSKTGMTRLERQALLEGLGVSSSRYLTPAMLEEAMRHFKKLGFVSTRKFHRPADSKQRLMRKIIAIRDDLRLTDGYIDGIVQQAKFKNKNGALISSYRWLNAQQLYKLVQMMSYHQARKAVNGKGQ